MLASKMIVAMMDIDGDGDDDLGDLTRPTL